MPVTVYVVSTDQFDDLNGVTVHHFPDVASIALTHEDGAGEEFDPNLFESMWYDEDDDFPMLEIGVLDAEESTNTEDQAQIPLPTQYDVISYLDEWDVDGMFTDDGRPLGEQLLEYLGEDFLNTDLTIVLAPIYWEFAL